MAIAALEFPNLKVCKGVELLPGLYDLALKSIAALQTHAQTSGTRLAPIEIMQGDILQTPWWQDADIVYSSSVCFPEELNEGIGSLCRHLKPGARVISL